MAKIGKYEFDNEQQCNDNLFLLSIESYENGNLIFPQGIEPVILKYIIIQNQELDENGNILQNEILHDKYCVDISYNNVDEPIFLKPFKIDLETNGSHKFKGIDYLTNKI